MKHLQHPRLVPKFVTQLTLHPNVKENTSSAAHQMSNKMQPMTNAKRAKGVESLKPEGTELKSYGPGQWQCDNVAMGCLRDPGLDPSMAITCYRRAEQPCIIADNAIDFRASTICDIMNHDM